MDTKKINDFVQFVSTSLKGDEKGEAQTFCDRLFKLFGHDGFLEAGGKFEARVQSKGKTKFIDGLWIPVGHSGVLIEMKKRTETNLEKHFPQAMNYWCQMNPQKVIGPGAQKPRYIILCNFDKIIIYDELIKVDELAVVDLPSRWTALNFLLPDERAPIFQNNTREISEKVARQIGELFQHMVFDLSYDRKKVQRFVLQCVVALFSEDVDLLPKDFFLELIQDCRTQPRNSFDLIGGLFRQMASKTPAGGGRFKNIRYFNGGLFETVEPLELDVQSLKYLELAARQDWRHVNPAIFGGLFEGTMSKGRRHEFGAHFTHADDIYKIIYPTIIRPWLQKITQSDTLKKLEKTWNELAQFRVLDPACGCGNFLFLAFQAIKELEMQIIGKIAEKFSQKNAQRLHLGMSRISTKNFLGLDIQPMAVELAKVTLMIAKELASIKWNEQIANFDKSLYLDFDESLPLDNLDENILCRDAVLEPWPEFDCVVGNPPYQSKNKMAAEMDNAYIAKIRQAFPTIPGRADFCVYWFRKTHALMKPGQRAGLVGTNTIRQNYSRQGGLDYIVQNGGTITDAVSTQVWPGEAVVYVSIVNWVKGNDDGEKTLSIQHGDKVGSPFKFFHPETINSSLSVEIDVSSAKALKTNANSQCCYQGQTHGHTGFHLSKDVAEDLLHKHPKYAEVLFPFLNGEELLAEKDSQPKRYVIDFRKQDCFVATQFKELYKIIQEKVYPDKKEKAENEQRKNEETLKKNPNAKVNSDHTNAFKTWWQLFRSRSEVLDIIAKIPRYIVCSRVTKRPVFEFISSAIHPNDALMVFPLADDYSFGILQSSLHWVWFQARCSTLKGDSRYTSNTVFDSFPWPQMPTVQAVEEVAARAQEFHFKRREIMTQNGYSLRDLYRKMEQTPNNPVTECQNCLDAAVCHAYGMNPDSNYLEFLLNLNLILYEKERNSEFVRGPGLPKDI